MRVLSVRQPWAALIVLGIKNVENRTWTTSYRGRLLIHASKTLPTNQEMEEALRLCTDCGAAFPDDLWIGGVIGSVDLVGIICRDGDEIRTDMADVQIDDLHGYNRQAYGLVLQNPLEFDEMIPMRGSLGLTTPPSGILAKIPR